MRETSKMRLEKMKRKMEISNRKLMMTNVVRIVLIIVLFAFAIADLFLYNILKDSEKRTEWLTIYSVVRSGLELIVIAALGYVTSYIKSENSIKDMAEACFYKDLGIVIACGGRTARKWNSYDEEGY